MPPPESPERPKNNLDIRSETGRDVVKLEEGIGQMEEFELQPENDTPELDNRAWDLQNVVKVGDVYFISGLKPDTAGTYPMQVLRMDKDGYLSKTVMKPETVDIAMQKILQMRGISTIPVSLRSSSPAPKSRTAAPKPAPETARRNPAGDVTIDNLFESLSLTVNGKNIAVNLEPRLRSAAGLASYLRKNGISVARYASYMRSMQDQKKILESVLTKTTQTYDVQWTGDHFEVTSGASLLRTTATDVFIVKPGAPEKSLLSGKTVKRIPKTAGTEFAYNDGSREYHRTDGIQYREMPDSTRQFFDGSNTQPLLEKKGKNIYVVAPDGSRVDVMRRPAANEADAYLTGLARRLKTPEAIAAYLSQFYLTHEYKAGGTDQQRWAKEFVYGGEGPVRYIADSPGMQEVQRWDETLVKGSGDCEDYALLGQELLQRAGIPSFCMLVNDNHYQAIYFEPAGRDENGREQFHVCSVGLSGFQRSTEVFTDLGQAAKSMWTGRSASGIESMNLTPAEKFEAGVTGPGVVVQEMPEEPIELDSKPGFQPYTGADDFYRYFVRRKA